MATLVALVAGLAVAFVVAPPRLAASALPSLSVVFWRSFARVGSANRRTRRVLGWFAVFSALSSLIMVVILVANTSIAADPAPALLALFNGEY